MAAEIVRELVAHPIGKMAAGAGRGPEGQRRGLRQHRLRARAIDEPGLDHVLQHGRGALARAGRIDRRGVARRRLEQAGQQRRLGQRDLGGGLAEVAPGGGVDAVGAGAEIHPVEIQGQDLVLGQMALEPDRQQQLLHLALEMALMRQEQVLGQLLGDRAAALADAAGAQIAERGADDAARIEARMAVEAAVLGGDDRGGEPGRQPVDGDGIADGGAEAGDGPAADVEQGGGRRADDAGDGARIGQVAREPQRDRGHGDQGRRRRDRPHAQQPAADAPSPRSRRPGRPRPGRGGLAPAAAAGGRFLLRPSRHGALDVEVGDPQRIAGYELATRLDLVAHQTFEQAVGFVALADLHLQQRARVGIERGLP